MLVEDMMNTPLVDHNYSMQKIVNFSGGVDSTLMVLELLENGENLILHHCILKTPTNRFEPETIACNNIIRKLKESYEFQYIETVVDVRSFKQTMDSLLVMQMAGTIAATLKLKDIYFGLNKDDDGPSYDYVSLANSMYSAPQVAVHFPLRSRTKKEVIDDLKKFSGYFELCFWCRNPNKETGEQCGTCPACQLIKRSRIK